MIVLYRCNLCQNEIKKYYATGVKQAPFLQCECKGVLEKQLPEFNTISYETVDNGVMAKRVSLRKDAVEKAKAKGDDYIKTMNNRDRVVKKDEN